MFIVIWEYEVRRGSETAFDRGASAPVYADFLDAAKVRNAQVDLSGDALTPSERCISRYRTPC